LARYNELKLHVDSTSNNAGCKTIS
jgi:hypothetical protein